MIKTILKGASIAIICSTLPAAGAPTKPASTSIDSYAYLRAGAGTSITNEKFKASKNAYDRRRPEAFSSFHVGIGYKPHKVMRTDITFQYAKVRYISRGSQTTGKQTIQTYAAFLNGYLDANLNCDLVPYMAAAIGIGYNKVGNFKNPLLFTLKGKNSTNFIWNLGAGAQYHATKNIALDVGYKYMNLGRARTHDSSYLFPHYQGANQPIRTQQIIGSLIYKF